MHSLTLRLTLAFLVVSLLSVALVAGAIWIITASEFDQFLLDRGQRDFLKAATAYYEANGSWRGVARALTQQGLLPPPPQPSDEKQPPQPFALVDQSNAVVVGGGPYRTGDYVSADSVKQGAPIVIRGQTVGVVLATGNPADREPVGEKYLKRINQALLIVAVGAAAVALLLGIFLARTITRPVRDLTAAAHAMAEGELGKQVAVYSQDELGGLSAAFNRMSADLERSNQARRQMMADIAHDLRTPLAVISGYFESLRDGVLKPSPARLDAMYSETQHLQRLVEDLRTLSLADAGELALNRQLVSPQSLLTRLATAYEHHAEQRGIALLVEVSSDLPAINVDPERMMQVLGNLVSNALRHTLSGGQIRLVAERQSNTICLSVQDTGEGIAPEILPRIFDRFFRGDTARRQEDGESGLGLAIAKAIVEAHRGSITAASELGKGATFAIALPVAA